MKVRLFWGIKGYFILKISKEKITKIIDILYNHGITYYIKKHSLSQDEQYDLYISALHYRLICDTFPSIFDDCECSSLKGLPTFFEKIKGRIGLIVGVVLSIFVYVFLSLFVWEVRIVGPQGYDEETVRQTLSQLGLKEGAYLPKLDKDSIASAYLLSSGTMSWMNIYQKGTVIYVQCEPNVSGEKHKDELGAKGANLIATSDAIIEELLIEKGRPTVVKGQVVKAGDLLVSGIYENALGSNFTCAKGQVMGRVGKTFSIFIPYEETVSTIEDHKTEKVVLSIFGREICLFGHRKDNLGDTYQKRTQVYLFQKIRLPIALISYKKTIVAERQIRHSEVEMTELAYQKCHKDITEWLKNNELVAKKVEGEFTNDGFSLTCEITYIENIAETIEFFIK